MKWDSTGTVGTAEEMCPCGQYRVHNDLTKCRLCLAKEMAGDATEWPELPTFGAHALRRDTRIGRLACVTNGVGLHGPNIRIHDHATVGSRPFEFVRDEDGRLWGFPPCGEVFIEDGVEIFPFANVDRGFMGVTVIREGAKLDHHVHIGHNSDIGRHTLLCAGAIIGGHCTIGDGAFIGLNATIKPRVKVGAGASVGMGAVVLRDVPAGETWAGNPARKIGD